MKHIFLFLGLVTAAIADDAITLPEYLDRVMTHNDAIRRQQSDLDRAAGTKLVYDSRFLPRLAVSVPAGLRTGNLYGNTEPFATATGHFAQPFLDVGIPASVRRGRLEVILAEQNLHLVVLNQLHAARITFLRTQHFRELIKLQEQIGERLQSNITAAQQRLDAGTGRRDQVLAAQVQTLNAKSDLIWLRAEYDNALTELARLAAAHIIVPAGNLACTPAKPDAGRDAEQALATRPDVLALRRMVEAARADRQLAQAGYFPFINLTASGFFIPGEKKTSQESVAIPGQQTRQSEYRLGGWMSWQMIDNGRVTGAARRLEAVRQQYEIALQRLEQNIPREVMRAVRAVETADAKLASLHQAESQAEENLKLIETKISIGDATQFDFLDAQRNWLGVRSGIAWAIYEHESALAESDRLTGRYVQFHDEAR